jgi:hypothetical protein
LGEKNLVGIDTRCILLAQNSFDMADAKICKTCLIEKPLLEFYKNPTGKHGRKSNCKVCEKPKGKAYYLRNKKAIKAYNRKYHEEHKEEANRKVRERRKSNIEKYTKKEKEQYRKHIERKKRYDRNKVLKITDSYIKIYLRARGIKEFTPVLIKKIRAKIKLGRKNGRKNGRVFNKEP